MDSIIVSNILTILPIVEIEITRTWLWLRGGEMYGDGGGGWTSSP
jgi:hypothetical protein